MLEYVDNGLRLSLAHQAVIDMDAGELFADGLD